MNLFLDEYALGNESQSNEVARQLEGGEAPLALATDLGLSPVAVVAAIARVGLGDEGSVGPSLVQAAPSRPTLAAVVAREATLAELFPQAARPARLALAAGLLQILDAWDASHHAAQAADDLGEATTSAAWHMVAHRREPDPSNARYWARRVPPSPIFTTLAPLGEALLNDEVGSDLRLKELSRWNSSTLIDLVAGIRPGSPESTRIRRLQRLEMLVLLSHSTALDG